MPMQWVDITGPAYWQAKTLVDSGTVIPSSPGAPADVTKGASLCVIDDIFYIFDFGTNEAMLNALNFTPLDGAYLDENPPSIYPFYAYTGGHWVPSAQTYSGIIVPALKYIGPAFPSRADVRVTLSAGSTATGAVSLLSVPGPWQALLDVNVNDFSSSNHLVLPIVFSPSFDPMLGGSDVATLGVNADHGTLYGVGGGPYSTADILSYIIAGVWDSSSHLVGVPTITKIEVYADFTPAFWTDFLFSTEQTA